MSTILGSKRLCQDSQQLSMAMKHSNTTNILDTNDQPTKPPREDRVDEKLYQISHLLTLSGFTSLHHTITSILCVNYSFKQGVIAAYKGFNSCFNPDILYLPYTLDSNAKCDFMSQRISPHLKKLSISCATSPVLLLIPSLFKNLTDLHLYRITDPIKSSNNKSSVHSSQNDENDQNKENNKTSNDITVNTDSNVSKDNNNNECNPIPTGQNLCLALKQLAPTLQQLTLNMFPYCDSLSDSLSHLTELKSLELNYILKPDRNKGNNNTNDVNDIFSDQDSNDNGNYNLTENDWIIISKGCNKLERLDLDKIYGLTSKSLKSLKKNCPQLGYFSVVSCEQDDRFDISRSDTIWYKICTTFRKKLKGLSLWNESHLNINEMAAICPNIEELSLNGIWATAMGGFSLFKNLIKLELIQQRYVYDLNEIAFNCDKLEEFSYTNEFPGKHSYSHDFMVFLDKESICSKNLKKIYTNDETCSLQMAKLIVYQYKNVEICDIDYKCNIFSERYENALEEWAECCQCEGESDVECDDEDNMDDICFGEDGVCREKWYYKQSKFLNCAKFDKDGILTGFDLFISTSMLKIFIERVDELVKQFGKILKIIEKEEFIDRLEELKDIECPGRLYKLIDLIVDVMDQRDNILKVINDGESKNLVDKNDENAEILNETKCEDIFVELHDVRQDIDRNLTKRPSFDNAAKDAIRILKLMKKFENEDYNDRINQLLEEYDENDEEKKSQFDLMKVLSLCVNFEKEYQGEDDDDDDEMKIDLDDEEMEMFDKLCKLSSRLYKFIVEASGIDIEQAIQEYKNQHNP